MTLHKEYKWDRFWCPSDKSYSLADGGFLVDPDSSWGKTLNPFSVKFQELSDLPCLILLGEPGMGKTNALEKAYREFHQIEQKRGIIFTIIRAARDWFFILKTGDFLQLVFG